MKDHTCFMKKALICTIVGTVLAIALSVFLLARSLQPMNLTVDVEPIDNVNYNNYIVDNQMDYRNDRLAWQSKSIFGTKLTLLSDDDTLSQLSGITCPFQLLAERVVYIKNSSLLVRNLNNKDEKRIDDNVLSFVATEESVVYLKEDVLLVLDWNTNKTTVLGQNVYQFFLHQNMIYMVDGDEQLMRLDGDGSWSKLYTFQDISYPFFVMPQGNTVVYLKNNEIVFVNFSTSLVETVRLSEGNYANNRISYICDDSQLYVSFQATKTDGSVVSNVTHSDNGVWCIDSQSKTKKKVCSETFEKLYLFDGNLLFGVKTDQLYQINTGSGEVIKVSS